MEDLTKIAKECALGDVRAQEKLYRTLAPKMYGVCLRFAKDNTEAEDNLQEGFVKVFSNIHKFRHEGSLEGWVRRIMVNVSLTKYRKEHLMHPVEDVTIYESPDVTDNALDKMSANELLELIQDLPPRYRMVFNLFVMEGMSHQEIGKAMNISEGTSKSNLARARDILRRKVKRLYGDLGKNENYSA